MLLEDNLEAEWNQLDFNDESFDSRDLGEQELNAFAFLGNRSAGDTVAEFYANDYLRFHVERGFIDPKYLTDDDEPWLTQEAMGKIHDAFVRDLNAHYWKENVSDKVTVDTSSSSGGDEPHVTFSIYVPYTYPGTVRNVLDDVVNPFFACVQNVTDPGTFNSVYIYDELND